MLVSAMFSMTSMIKVPSANAAVPSSVGPLEGPYFKEIRFKIYASSQAVTQALVAGDVDVIDFFEAEQIPDIQPGLTAGTINYTQGAEQGQWVFALQCQRYPLNITDFRRAIAHLVDKNKIVAEGLQGLAYKIETFCGSPGYGDWAGRDYVTYEFSPTKAGEILDRLGFVKGADGKRIDPKTGLTMRPLVIYARVEHPHRIFSARELARQMDVVGIPYELNEVPRAVTSAKVFLEQDYDIYTAGWGGGPDVDWMYDNFYSTSPPSMNFMLFRNSTMDAALDRLKFSPTREQCVQAQQEVERIVSEQLPCIPLYAKAYISPYSSRVTHVVDLAWRSGVTNWMTFFYARDRDQKYGSVLNVGWSSDPQQPSPLYNINWWWDGMVVDTVYEYLMDADPVTFKEIPWLAKSWSVEPWTASGDIPGLKITYNLVENATWHDGLPVTADDVVFTWLYTQREANPVYISYLLNLVTAEATDRFTAVAYLNTTSYWALHWLGENIPMIPKHIWENITNSVQYQPITEGNLIGSGSYKFKEYRPGEYFIIEANPNYWRRPKDSTLGLTPLTLTQGESRTFSKAVVYHGTPITNGTYTLTLTSAGELVKTVTGSVASNGTYSATLDTTSIQPGKYLLGLKLAVPVSVPEIGMVGLGSLDQYDLTVQAPTPTTTTTTPTTTTPVPMDYTLIVGALVVIVVIVAAGYVVLRRRGSTT